MTLNEVQAVFEKDYPNIPWSFVLQYFVWKYHRAPGNSDAATIIFMRTELEQANTHRVDFGYVAPGSGAPSTMGGHSGNALTPEQIAAAATTNTPTEEKKSKTGIYIAVGFVLVIVAGVIYKIVRINE